MMASSIPFRQAVPAALILLSLAFIGRVFQPPPCETPGWFPTGFGVKDHAVFHDEGYTYIAAIQLPDEKQFAYTRSLDTCTWEPLSPILTDRTDGSWDENRIWAPFVLQEGGTYYMYYTGVNDAFAQSILLASTTTPSDPGSWQEHGMIFQPNHPGAVWSPNAWSNNRDPMVVRNGQTYLMYYTGRDTGGGIIGLATAPHPEGPWTDQGAALGPFPNLIMESPTFFRRLGVNYLLYHNTWLGQSFGAAYRTAPSPSGPWSPPAPMFPGWAHEIWRTPAGSWFASYLTGYSITIAPLQWDASVSPDAPFIGEALLQTYLPAAGRSP